MKCKADTPAKSGKQRPGEVGGKKIERYQKAVDDDVWDEVSDEPPPLLTPQLSKLELLGTLGQYLCRRRFDGFRSDAHFACRSHQVLVGELPSSVFALERAPENGLHFCSRVSVLSHDVPGLGQS